MATHDPEALVIGARQMIDLSVKNDQHHWDGADERMPAAVQKLNPQNVWVMPDSGFVDIQLTSGFYQSGVVVTSGTQTNACAEVITYPCRRISAHVSTYRGFIAER